MIKSNFQYEASIIVMNKNRIELLKNCLESIKKNTTDVNYELIVVDALSIDGSREYLLSEWSDKATLIFEKDNTSYAASNNRAMRWSYGKYVYLLNNDCEATDGWLRNAIDFTEKDKSIGHTASLVLWPDGKVMSHGANLIFSGCTDACYRGFPEEHPELKKQANFAYAGFGLYRRDLLESIGYLPEYPCPIYFDDSIMGNRFTVIKNNEKIEIISFENLFDKYKNFISYEEGREVIHLDECGIDLFALSSEKQLGKIPDNFRSNILTSHQLDCLNGEGKGSKDTINLTKKRASDILEKKAVIGKWGKINKIIRHKTDKDIYRVNCATGETIITNDHSLIKIDNDNLIEAKINQIDLKKDVLAKVQTPPDVEIFESIDLKEWLPVDKFIFDEEFVYPKTEYRQRLCRKIYRFLSGEKLESLMVALGAYISEGCTYSLLNYKSKNMAISNTNIEWLNKIKKALENITVGLVFNITKPSKKDNTCNIVSNSVLMYEFFKHLGGQKSRHKKLSGIEFHVSDKYKKIFLENIIFGDGYKSKGKTQFEKLMRERRSEQYFQYTSNSLELISGMSFLLLQVGIRFSMSHRPSNNSYTIRSKYSHRFQSNGQLKVTKEIKKDDYVYDLSIEGSEMFVDACGNILLHNTAYSMEVWRSGFDVRYCPSSTIIHKLYHDENRVHHKNAVAIGLKAFNEEWGDFLLENNGFHPDFPFTGIRPYKNGEKKELCLRHILSR